MEDYTLPRPPGEGTSSLIGVGLALGASLLIATGLNVQRLAHIRRQHKRDGPPPPSSSSTASSSANSATPLRRTRSSRPEGVEDERTPLLKPPGRVPHGRSTSDPEISPENPHVLVPVISTTSATPPSSSPSSPSPSPSPSTDPSPPPPALHRVRSRSRTRRPRTDKGFLRSKLWLVGFFLLNCGEFLNFLAYGFAPPSVVAPLGMVSLIANVFLAPLIVREPFRKRDLIGVVIAILGGVVVVYAARSSDRKPTPDEFLTAISQPLFIAYASVSTATIAVLAYLSNTKYGDRFVLIDLSLCALAGAFTVLSTKAISSFVNLNPAVAIRSWITYPTLLVLAVTAVLQVNFVNKSLQRFESRVVIPIQYCTFALSTICGSAVLYRDFDGIPLPSMINFMFGCLVCGAGVYLLTQTPSSSASSASSSSPSKKKAPSNGPSSASASRTHPNAPTPLPHSATIPRSSGSGGSTKPSPFPSISPLSSSISTTPSHNTIPTTTTSDGRRLLPVPLALATDAGAGAGAGRGRKASLTLGGAYLLAGSPTGIERDDEDEDGGGSGSGSEGEDDGLDEEEEEDGDEEEAVRGRG
ncbi:hypothetical protein JCM6882_000358 [Rhodosporidiobolus microsporus]